MDSATAKNINRVCQQIDKEPEHSINFSQFVNYFGQSRHDMQVCTRISIYVYVCIDVCIHAYMYTVMFVCVCIASLFGARFMDCYPERNMYVCMNAYVYMCVCERERERERECVCVCVYTYTHASVSRGHASPSCPFHF